MDPPTTSNLAVNMLSSQLPDEEDENGRSRMQRMLDAASFGLFGVAVVLSGIAMGLNPMAVVYVAGVWCIAESLYGASQRVRLKGMETLREVHNRLRHEVNAFMDENDKLQHSVDELEEEVSKVEAVERGLNDIVSKQGRTVATFVDAVKENGRIIEEIKENQKAVVTQELIQLVLSADRDMDMNIDPEEVYRLVLKLNNFEGILVDEDKLRARLRDQGRNIGVVLDIIREFKDNAIKDEDCVIQLNVEDMRNDMRKSLLKKH